MKKFVKVALMLVLTAFLLCVSVGAQEDDCLTADLTVESLIHGDIPELLPRYSQVSLLDVTPEYALYQLMIEAIENDNLTIDLTAFNSQYGAMIYVPYQPLPIVQGAYNYLLCSHPELFYISNEYEIRYASSTKAITELQMKYSMTKNEIQAATEFFYNAIDEIVSLVPAGCTDYEKVLFINDYIATNFEYDNSFSIYDAYNMLKQGTAVCQGYTLLFTAIMDELGIPVDYCTSDAMNHVWNYVQLDGKWYHIDTTWNDPTPNVYGRAAHTYFLLSDNYIQSTEGEKSSHYDYNSLYDCTDTTFDGLGIGFDSPLIEFEDKWYTTAFNSEDNKSYLYKLESPYFPPLSLDDSVIDLGYRHTSPGAESIWGLCASYIYKFGDCILVNNEESVYLFDGETYEIVYTPEKADEDYIYGFGCIDDKLLFQLNDSPNDMNNADILAVEIEPVTYLDSDGTLIAEAFKIDGGQIPQMLVPENPEKADDEFYSYTFKEWKQTDKNVFTAVYDKKMHEDVEVIIDGNLEYYNKHGKTKIKFVKGQFKHIGHHAFDDNEVTAIILPDDVEDVEADSFEGVPNAMVYLSRKNQKLHDSLKGFNLMQHRYLEDMNFDRKIDIMDFTYLVSGIVHKATASLDSICADMNEDESIDLKDIRALVRSLAD